MTSSFVSRLGRITFGLVVAILPALLHASPESDFETRRDQERKNYDTMIANMPMLDVHRLADVLRVTMENKELVVRTHLPSTVSDGYMRAKFTDHDVAGLVRIQGGAIPPTLTPVVPSLLQFNLTDYTQAGRITTLSVNTQAAYCSISKSTQYPGGGFRNTLLIQQMSRVSEGGGSIHLTVNEVGRDGSSPVNVELQGNDFFSLLHNHPGECEAFVRPLLRELGQESIFAPDPLVAWQVFAETWKPDPAVDHQIQGLLPSLNSDDFHLRWQASRELEKLGRDGAAVLIHLDRTRLTPEQNARVDLALAPYAQLPAKEAVHLRSDPGFLLDCLYSDDAVLEKLALGRLREVADPTIQFDINADPATRAAAIAGLRLRLVPTPK
jgi:hypothetical protein